jgi:XTP/dITP diphosphohydrolase
MFVPLGADETFGEMEPARKHAISHRARAFEALAAACLPLLDPHIRETGGR